MAISRAEKRKSGIHELDNEGSRHDTIERMADHGSIEGLGTRDRRDGVSASINVAGQLEAPDTLDKDDLADNVNCDAMIKQIIFEGQQSREKGNAADFSQHRQSWASATSTELTVQGESERTDRRQDGGVNFRPGEDRCKTAEEEARKRAQEGPTMMR